MNPIIEITNFEFPELDVYARLNESQLLHFNEPNPGIFIAESPKVIERALNAGYHPISFLIEKKEIGAQAEEIFARWEAVPVYSAEFEVLKQLTGFGVTRGMLCAMERLSLKSVEEVCKNARRIAVLEKVVNPTNEGAIYRSVFLCGFVPCQQAVGVIDRVGIGVAVVDVAQILGCAALAAAVSPFTDSATL